MTFGSDTELDDSKINDIEQVAEYYTTYRLLSSINIIVTFLRIIQYYKFSKKLSNLFSVISESTMDIFFFGIMFIIVIYYSL